MTDGLHDSREFWDLKALQPNSRRTNKGFIPRVPTTFRMPRAPHDVSTSELDRLHAATDTLAQYVSPENSDRVEEISTALARIVLEPLAAKNVQVFAALDVYRAAITARMGSLGGKRGV